MKYNSWLGIFIITLILSLNICSDLTKPNRSKNIKRSKSIRKQKNIKKYPKKLPKLTLNAIESPVDLDVLLRFKFAKYGSNVLANFVSGILSAFYNRLFQVIQKQENSQYIVDKHIKCVQKQLHSIFNNNDIIRTFENKFIFGGLYPMKKNVKNYFVFTHQYKVLRRKNKVMRIMRKLKNLTGTFQRIKRFNSKKHKMNSLFRKNVKRTNKNKRKYWKNSRKSKKDSKKSRKSRNTWKSNKNFKKSRKSRNTRKSNKNSKRSRKSKNTKKSKKNLKKTYVDFKITLINRQVKKSKKEKVLKRKLKKLLGRNSKQIAEHAKFMTYAFRKVWFYTSFFTKKILSCSITSSNGYPSIQKVFLSYFKTNQRVTCPYNHVDVLTLMMKSSSLRSSFNKIFYNLLVKGIKNRHIHKINWFKIGQAIFSAHQELAILCPWFK